MKITLFFMILFLGIGFSNAQENRSITGKYYVTNIDVSVQEIDFYTDTLSSSDTSFIAKKGTKFTVVGLVNSANAVKVKFWRYTKLSVDKTDKSKYTFIDFNQNGKYFLLNLTDLDEKTQLFYGKSWDFTYGFSVVPYKLRFGNKRGGTFQYAEGVSVGLNAGFEVSLKSRKQQSFSFLLGVAGSTVAVDQQSTNKFLEPGTLTSTGAFSPSIGALYSFERFQAGFFLGMDYIPGELGRNWVYRNKPWLGVGIGFAMYQKNKTEATGNQNQ